MDIIDVFENILGDLLGILETDSSHNCTKTAPNLEIAVKGTSVQLNRFDIYLITSQFILVHFE